MFVPYFGCALIGPLSSLMGKRGLVALLCSSSWSLVIVIAFLLFLAVPWVGLQCLIVAFPDQNHLLLSYHASSNIPLSNFVGRAVFFLGSQ